jgi:CheY-like chemotaxis protein
MTVDVDRALPRWIRGDGTRLRQILVNLLGNAVKFTESGSVTLTVKRSADGGELQFAVRDTGCGIPADRLDRLFRAFSQVDASITRKYGGTGLGLVISKKLTEIMGGRIWVKSELGKGSAFHFVVPLRTASEQEALRTGTSDAPVRQTVRDFDMTLAKRHPLRLLLAEDNVVNQKVLVAQLKRLGYHSDVVANGLEALTAVHRQTYDLILMDVQMPEMDGLEASRRIIQEVEAERRPRLIALTANVFKSDQAACFAAGMDGFLGKPVDLAELRDALLQCRAIGAAHSVITEAVSDA